MIKQFCSKEHDTFKTGRTLSRNCSVCDYIRCTVRRKANPQIHIKRVRDWQKRNPKKHYAYTRATSLRRKYRVPKFGQVGITEFYEKCPEGMTVDHKYPLCGKTVSGLHVIWNLQYLTPHDNFVKGNRG